jgi:uncharacterized protein (TIGR02757 family)
MTDIELKELLDKEVEQRDCEGELCLDRPDPLLVASKHKDEYIALLCALFGYGKASLIVKFCDSLDYDLLDSDEGKIKKELSSFYYRFQNSDDVIAIFIALSRLKKQSSLNNLFIKGYKKENSVLEGMEAIIKAIYEIYEYNSRGYQFLVGTIPKKDKSGNIKEIGNAPYKRWNMYLRWMVRKDTLDMGLWNGVDKSDLILPLDTHTFNVSKRLGLLNRKTYDLKSALLITDKLKIFDKNDPIKYDFAIYRLGQEKLY